jgi:hypothetical protein
MVMPYNYNKQHKNKKNGKALTGSPNFLQEHTALTTVSKINNKTDLARMKQICEELPNHCVQFFFLS